MVRRFSPFVSVVAFVAAIPAVAAPAVAASIEDRVRPNLDSTVLSYRSFTASSEVGTATRSSTTIGVGAPGIGFGLGYGVSENVLLGARLLLTSTSESGGNAPSVASQSVAVVAEPEYVFDGDELRPFVGAMLGYRSVASESASVDTSTSLAVLGASVGAHWFVLNGVSFDPKLTAAYETGSGASGPLTFDQSGLALGVSFGISAWLGGSEPARAADATLSSPAANDQAAPESNAPDPSTTFTNDAAGDTHASIPLAGSGRLVLRPSPESNGAVEAVLLLPETPDLPGCTSLDVVGTGEPLSLGPVSPERIQDGFSSLVALHVTLPAGTARAVGRARDVSLEGCGERIVVGSTAKSALVRFAGMRRAHETKASGR